MFVHKFTSFEYTSFGWKRFKYGSSHVIWCATCNSACRSMHCSPRDGYPLSLYRVERRQTSETETKQSSECKKFNLDTMLYETLHFEYTKGRKRKGQQMHFPKKIVQRIEMELCACVYDDDIHECVSECLSSYIKRKAIQTHLSLNMNCVIHFWYVQYHSYVNAFCIRMREMTRTAGAERRKRKTSGECFMALHMWHSTKPTKLAEGGWEGERCLKRGAHETRNTCEYVWTDPENRAAHYLCCWNWN